LFSYLCAELQKMTELAQYDQQTTGSLAKNGGNDTFTFRDVAGSAYIQDSVSFEADSLLRTPSDTTFRFFEIKPDEILFIGDARYPRDSTYCEKIIWDGLTSRFREKQHIGQDWLTFVLFFVLLLYTSSRAEFPRYIATLFHSLVNYTASSRMFREKNYSFTHAAFRLEVMFYICISVFVFQIFKVLSAQENTSNNFLEFAQLSAIIIGYFIIKKQLYKMLGSLFIGAADTSEILFNIGNYNRATGLILFPIVGLIAFNPYGSPVFAGVAGIAAVIILYGMMLQRGISILLKKQASIFYLFLYLCTLEFLPMLLVYKLVVG